MSIKRFGYGLTDEDLQESPVGPYVRWEDYERLYKALQCLASYGETEGQTFDQGAGYEFADYAKQVLES